jgi:hypothetical protein
VVAPSLQFLRQQLGGAEPSPTPGITVGRGGSGVLVPAIVVSVAALVIIAVLVALGRRGRRRRRLGVNVD